MKSLSGMVAAAVCLLAWRAECQGQSEGGPAGLYVSPAYSGDSGGPYVSPAFGGGGTEAAPGTGGAPGVGRGFGRAERGRSGYGSGSGYGSSYGVGNFGAYTTPAFSGPTLGLRVTPLPPKKAKPKSDPGSSSSTPSNGMAPVKPSGISDPQSGGGGTSTNKLENPALPPSPGTNAPAGQGSSGAL